MALVSGGLLMAGCSEKAPLLGKAPIDEVIKAMTLEEKVHLLIGTGMERVGWNSRSSHRKNRKHHTGSSRNNI